LQQVRGFGAFDTGLAILPQAIAAAIFMPFGGVLFDRIGARPLVVLGLGLVAIATFLLGQVSVHTQAADLIAPLALAGAGKGLMMMSLNTHLINAAPRALVSRVTSLTNASQQVINGLTIAALATILTSRMTTHITSATAARAIHTQAPGATPAALARPRHALVTRAMALGFDDTFHVMIVAAIAGAVLGILLRRNHAAQAAVQPEALLAWIIHEVAARGPVRYGRVI